MKSESTIIRLMFKADITKKKVDTFFLQQQSDSLTYRGILTEIPLVFCFLSICVKLLNFPSFKIQGSSQPVVYTFAIINRGDECFPLCRGVFFFLDV